MSGGTSVLKDAPAYVTLESNTVQYNFFPVNSSPLIFALGANEVSDPFIVQRPSSYKLRI